MRAWRKRHSSALPRHLERVHAENAPPRRVSHGTSRLGQAVLLPAVLPDDGAFIASRTNVGSRIFRGGIVSESRIVLEPPRGLLIGSGQERLPCPSS
jgi:hypothetical protein